MYSFFLGSKDISSIKICLCFTSIHSRLLMSSSLQFSHWHKGLFPGSRTSKLLHFPNGSSGRKDSRRTSRHLRSEDRAPPFRLTNRGGPGECDSCQKNKWLLSCPGKGFRPAVAQIREVAGRGCSLARGFALDL